MQSLANAVLAGLLAQDTTNEVPSDLPEVAADPGAAETPDAVGEAGEAISEAGDFISNLDQEQVVDLAQTYLVPVAIALVVLLIGLFIAGWTRRMVVKASTKAKVETTLAKFFGSLAKWGVMILTGIVILGILGIETASFAVVLGAAGFAIGMAMQGSLGNLAAGVMLLIFRPFKVGQVVSVGGVTGKVDEIDLFTTTLDTPDNRRFIVPNGTVFGATIENISFHATRRVDVAVGTDYGADLAKTREVLMQAAQALPAGMKDPEPAIFLGDLGDSSIGWSVRVWVNADDYWPSKQELTKLVKEHLDNAGIGIPFPQMDVHLDKLD